jgi:DNA-binding MarR family transcriptional regulator
MNLMLAVRQGLTAVDAIMRQCAKASGLERSEALVLGLVHARPGRGASQLAIMTGQPRQQAHRSLLKLEQPGLLEPRTRLRNMIGWRLTPVGEELWAHLCARLRGYEEVLCARVPPSARWWRRWREW